jgi:predicted metalloprotease with PDZ domain
MKARTRISLALFLVALATVAEGQTGGATTPAQSPVAYTLSFPAPATHYLEVEATIPTGGRPDLDLMMPVWTPGSYLVREHSRHVEAVRATGPDGRVLPIEKIAKNRWRVVTTGADAIALTYRVYAREMSVRTNWVDARFALINGAGTFITPIDGLDRPHHVRVTLPPAWRSAISGMPPATTAQSFVAEDFDTLVDSPIVAGNPSVHDFKVEGVPHTLVNVLDDGTWDVGRSLTDLEKIIGHYSRMMGGLPYERYVIFNLLTDTGGGLEHHNSTVLMASRGATSTRRRYVSWLSLASHEIFHAWNVKRLRPIELGPFDYEAENYTRSLWVAEGLTEYYADLALRRAGITSDEEYLVELSNLIGTLQTTPGRFIHAVEESSFDAWIRQYRPDENSPNVTISYYTKGAVIGFVLDAAIRRSSDGRRSLDDVMRVAFQRFSGARGFTPAEFREVVSEVAGADLSEILRRLLESTDEIDYREALDWFGLRFVAAAPATMAGTPAWQGLRLRQEGDRLMVTQVRRGTPAYGSGINVGDQLLAVNDARVDPDRWRTMMDRHPPGEPVTVLVARRGEQMRFTLRVGPPDINQWQLRRSTNPTPAQQDRLRRWLMGF